MAGRSVKEWFMPCQCASLFQLHPELLLHRFKLLLETLFFPLTIVDNDRRESALGIYHHFVAALPDYGHDGAPVAFEDSTHGVRLVRQSALCCDFEDLRDLRTDTYVLPYRNHAE